MLELEITGEESDQNKAKRAALEVWVKGVNDRGALGVWCWDVAFDPARVWDILAVHGS
jgi:type III restriction enzyme